MKLYAYDSEKDSGTRYVVLPVKRGRPPSEESLNTVWPRGVGSTLGAATKDLFRSILRDSTKGE